MELVKLINNRNLKKLLKKKHLTKETVWEIKTSLFIHPSTDEGDDLYSFNYNVYDGRKVIELFTSLDEYDQVYKRDDYMPLPWYFNQFEHSFDEDTEGILINPATDNFFIPYWVSVLIMEDMDEVSRTIELNAFHMDVSDLKDFKPMSDYLNEYLSGKTKITYIDRLFDVLSTSAVYVLYESEESLDGHFKGDVLSLRDVDSHYYKKDNHIMVFTDRDDFKEVMDLKYHYCYGVADLMEVIRAVFEFDYDGVILKTPESEFELARHRLLKYWDRIVENYCPIDTAPDYGFKIVGQEHEGL